MIRISAQAATIDFIHHNLHDLEMMDISFKKKNLSPLIAFCTSEKCSKKSIKKNGKYDNIYTKFGTIKKVSTRESFCPDCSSALFWQRESEVRDAAKKLGRI